MNVRRLQAEDADALRKVRLRALRNAPDAFWTTYDREATYGPEDWRRWIATAALFMAEDPALGVGGIAGGLGDLDDPSGSLLISMWVAPEHRGSGVADRLVAAVTAWSLAEGRPTVRLHVEEHNHRARRCYQRLGFQLTGRRLLRERDGRWELEMVVHIRTALISSGGSQINTRPSVDDCAVNDPVPPAVITLRDGWSAMGYS